MNKTDIPFTCRNCLRKLLDLCALRLPYTNLSLCAFACAGVILLAALKYLSLALLAHYGQVLNPYLDYSLADALIWALPHDIKDLARLLFAASIEELVFRGLFLIGFMHVLSSLSRSLSTQAITLISIIASAAFFSLFHLVNLCVLPLAVVVSQALFAFLAGLYLGWLRAASKSIFLPIAAHSLLNLFL